MIAKIFAARKASTVIENLIDGRRNRCSDRRNNKPNPLADVQKRNVANGALATARAIT
jgi:hypothetical protein